MPLQAFSESIVEGNPLKAVQSTKLLNEIYLKGLLSKL
jgi:hypothetical protein